MALSQLGVNLSFFCADKWFSVSLTAVATLTTPRATRSNSTIFNWFCFAIAVCNSQTSILLACSRIRTPGGVLAVQYRTKKAGRPKCSECKTALPGVRIDTFYCIYLFFILLLFYSCVLYILFIYVFIINVLIFLFL